MKSTFHKYQEAIHFLGSVANSIRLLGQMAETIIISLTSVDALQGKGFNDFSLSLLPSILNNLGVRNYPAKNHCTILTTAQNLSTLFPIS